MTTDATLDGCEGLAEVEELLQLTIRCGRRNLRPTPLDGIVDHAEDGILLGSLLDVAEIEWKNIERVEGY